MTGTSESATTAPSSTVRNRRLGGRVLGVSMRIAMTITALAISAFVLFQVTDQLEWPAIRSALGALSLAEVLTLLMGAGLVIAAQGLVTSSVVPALSVRRGILAFLGPAAVASLIPGPSDLPVRYRMLASWGYSPGDSALAVSASGIFSVGAKLVMPIAALVVGLLAGVALSDGASTAVITAGIVLGSLVMITAVTLRSARVAASLAYWLEAPWTVVTRLLRRDHEPLAIMIDATRNRALKLLHDRWIIATWAVFLHTVAQVGLMVMALRFTGVPATTLGTAEVFIAFGIVQGLTILPITAGSAGVAEAGWIALFAAMASGTMMNEITAAVILYRVLTWLAVIPAGAVAMMIWRLSRPPR